MLLEHMETVHRTKAVDIFSFASAKKESFIGAAPMRGVDDWMSALSVFLRWARALPTIGGESVTKTALRAHVIEHTVKVL